MATEKTPVLHTSQTPYECNATKEQLCSRPTINCILAAILIALFVVVVIEFLYPVNYERIRFHVYDERPVEVKLVPPTYEDYIVVNPGGKFHPWDHEFLIDPADLCATANPPNSEEYLTNPEVKLLMMVPSAVDHFEQREAIRKTWGSVAERPLGPIRLGFVLGTTTNKTISDLIRKESQDYKDIIQVDILDSHMQLTVKSVLTLKWVAKRCPYAQYFLRVDDDTFVNVHIVADLLNGEPYISQDKFIGGHAGYAPAELFGKQQAVRLTANDFPLQDYPPYASGSAYVMSIPTVIELFDASKEVQPFLDDDDAMFMALCAQHIDAALFHEPKFCVENPPMPPSWNAYSTLATAHSVSPPVLEIVWTDMVQSIPDTMAYIESAINSTSNRRVKKHL